MGLITGIAEVEIQIRISRYQEAGTFIVQNGPAKLVQTKVGVAQVIIEIPVLVAGPDQTAISIDRFLETALPVSLI